MEISSMKSGFYTNGITNGMSPKLPAAWKRMSKQQFMDVVEKYMGITTAICNVLDLTYSQFWSAVSHWQLRDFVQEQKANLVSKAEEAVYRALDSQSEQAALRAAELVLKSKQARSAGWAEDKTPQPVVVLTDEEKTEKIKSVFGL